MEQPGLSAIQERMPPGNAERLHVHHQARQLLDVLEGTLSIDIGDEAFQLAAGDSLEITPGAAHPVRTPPPPMRRHRCRRIRVAAYRVPTALVGRGGGSEEAFVASLSSCHLLWFFSMAVKRGLVVDRYVDEAVGNLERNAAGKLAITRVTLRPQVAFAGAPPIGHRARGDAPRSTRRMLHRQLRDDRRPLRADAVQRQRRFGLANRRWAR